jgi:hypothetical protein
MKKFIFNKKNMYIVPGKFLNFEGKKEKNVSSGIFDFSFKAFFVILLLTQLNASKWRLF